MATGSTAACTAASLPTRAKNISGPFFTRERANLDAWSCIHALQLANIQICSARCTNHIDMHVQKAGTEEGTLYKFDSVKALVMVAVIAL